MVMKHEMAMPGIKGDGLKWARRIFKNNQVIGTERLKNETGWNEFEDSTPFDKLCKTIE